VVECCFAYNGQELTGAKDIMGRIQVLTYPGDPAQYFPRMQFWYQFVDYKDRFSDHLDLVKCGNSTPVLMRSKNGQEYVGNLDLSSEVASICVDGKEEKISGGPVNNCQVLCRNWRKPDWVKVMGDQWMDRNENSDFPANAYGVRLKMDDGSQVMQCVALWYKHGEPVMGRCWNQGGKLKASFGWDGKEFSTQLGSMQVLCYDPMTAGYDYDWRPFSQMKTAGWTPVHVGDVAPCIITNDKGFQLLGKVYMSKEKAGAPWGSRELVITGPHVQNFLVLCTRNKP
jgi:hypothetical protein